MFYDIKSLISDSEDFYGFVNNSALLLSSVSSSRRRLLLIAQKGVDKNKQTRVKKAFDWLSLKASEWQTKDFIS